MAEISKKKFGKYIRAKREEQNITREDFAQKLHISYQAVSNWEAGRRVPELGILGDIAEVLGITVQDIYDNSKRDSNHNLNVIKIIGLILILSLLVGGIILKFTRLVSDRPDKDEQSATFAQNNEEVYAQICEYLENNLESSTELGEGVEKVCAYSWLDSDEKYIYIIAYSITWRNNHQQKSESIIPVRLGYIYQEEKLEITDCVYPKDGNYYAKDCYEIFPEHLMDAVLGEGWDNPDFENIKEKALERAKEKYQYIDEKNDDKDNNNDNSNGKVVRLYHGFPTMFINSNQERYINQYLEEAGCDFSIKLVGNDTGLAYDEYLSQAKKAGEIIDIEWSDLGTYENKINYIKRAEAGEYYAINELLETENGKKLIKGLNQYMTPEENAEKMLEYLEQYRLKDGNIYGIPMNINYAAPYFLSYNKNILDQYGVEELSGDITDVDKILAKADEMVKDKIIPLKISIETTCSDSLFGALFGYEPYEVFWLLNCEEEKLEAINVFENEDMLSWYQKLGEARQKGFLGLHEEPIKKIDENLLMDVDNVSGKEAGCIFTGVEYNGIGMLRVEGEKVDYDVLNVETGLPVRSVLCIDGKTAYPKEAFQFLEMMYYDTDFRRLMHLGPEGIGYEIEEKEGKKILKKYPGGRAGIVVGLGLEDDFLMYQKYDNEDFHMYQEKIYEGNSYAHRGIVGLANQIDFTSVKEEYDACKELFEDNLVVFYGLYGDKTKEELGNLYKKLVDAGYLKVLAEMNRQLGAVNED